MSIATKRKHVFKEVLEDFSPPAENQQIVRITERRGNNLHEIVTPDNIKFLVSMPTKFRKNVWVKRGSYVIIERIEEGCKVKGEIVRILLNEQIKSFKKDKIWPDAFCDEVKKDSETDDEDDIPANTNRVAYDYVYDSDSDDSSNESSCSE